MGKTSGPQKQDICPKAQVSDLSKGVVKQSHRWELNRRGWHRNGALPWRGQAGQGRRGTRAVKKRDKHLCLEHKVVPAQPALRVLSGAREAYTTPFCASWSTGVRELVPTVPPQQPSTGRLPQTHTVLCWLWLLPSRGRTPPRLLPALPVCPNPHGPTPPGLRPLPGAQ